MPNKYEKAISEIKASNELKEKIKLNLETKNVKRGVDIMSKIQKMLITIGTLVGMAVCGGLVYAGITANKPHVENSGISFSDNYNEYEYSVNQSN